MALPEGTKSNYRAPKKRKRKPARSQAPAPRRSSPPPPPSYGKSVERPGSSSQVRNPRSLRSYPFLTANAGINWRDVNPTLLSKLNALGRAYGEIITITSGFRTHEEQRHLYYTMKAADPNAVVAEPGTSNHEGGQAVDALVDGQPIASVIDEETLNRAGIRSLAHINDPVHVELSGGGGDYTPPSGGGAGGVEPSQPTYGSPPPSMAPIAAEGPSYTQQEQLAPAVLPFEVNEDEEPAFLSPQQRSETWQLIASLPGASPETQQIARMLSIGG